MTDKGTEPQPAEDPTRRAWRDEVEREYRTLMTALLVERQRPIPAREPALPDHTPVDRVAAR